MKFDKDLCRDVNLVPRLEASIDRWLAARNVYKMQPSDENQHNYNATYFALGEAFAQRYPEAAANMPSAFDWYRRGLIAPEDDSPSGDSSLAR